MTGNAGRHVNADGSVLWQAAANGEQVTYLTTDPDLVLTARGIANHSVIGVALVDETGQQVALSIRSRVPFD